MSPEPDYIPLWPDGLPDDDIRHEHPEQTVNREVDQNASGLNRAISNVIDFGMKNSITRIAPGAEERWDAYLRGFDPAAARITQRVSEVRFAD